MSVIIWVSCVVISIKSTRYTKINNNNNNYKKIAFTHFRSPLNTNFVFILQNYFFSLLLFFLLDISFCFSARTFGLSSKNNSKIQFGTLYKKNKKEQHLPSFYFDHSLFTFGNYACACLEKIKKCYRRVVKCSFTDQ